MRLLEAVGQGPRLDFGPRGLASVVVVMALKVVLTVPTTVTATMIITEMSAAMSPYSIAVAPASRTEFCAGK